MPAILLKASFILAILLVFYKLFLEKESFFSVNRAYLITCLAFAFTLPYISLPKMVEQQGLVSQIIEQVEPKGNVVITTNETLSNLEIKTETLNPVPFTSSDRTLHRLAALNLLLRSRNFLAKLHFAGYFSALQNLEKQ
jgi:hypothetical protein